MKKVVVIVALSLVTFVATGAINNVANRADEGMSEDVSVSANIADIVEEASDTMDEVAATPADSEKPFDLLSAVNAEREAKGKTMLAVTTEAEDLVLCVADIPEGTPLPSNMTAGHPEELAQDTILTEGEYSQVAFKELPDGRVLALVLE